MTVIPAIDIIDGICVRLFQGDYATAHKVAEDPFKTAKEFEKAGATLLHMVDLDGAKDGKMTNADLIIKVANSVNMDVEVGGGIRNMESIDYYIENGIDRVILGSVAIKNKDLVKEAVEKHGEKIVVGIDAKDGMVRAEGWTDESKINYLDLAKKMEEIGVKTIIYTDIAKDGTLAGPNLGQLDDLTSAVSCDIIASGGVSNVVDIVNLAELDIYGAISGKAIYTGDLDLKQAIEVCGKV